MNEAVRLRDVELTDLDAYRDMRSDAEMMADLGGPIPADRVERSLAREVRETQSGQASIVMIDVASDGIWHPAGNVSLIAEENTGDSEIGWMVLPAFRGRGLTRWAVTELLGRAGASQRWGTVHAYPSVSNAASNSICASLGFRLEGRRNLEFNGRVFEVNAWTLRPPYSTLA